jgi:hypothetical protein
VRLRHQLTPLGVSDMAALLRSLIGIVGYSPVLDCYPLGPCLMEGLRTRLRKTSFVEVENMTWGPIHIVQRFQAPETRRPDRLVLVGEAPVSRAPGQVTAYRWLGGRLSESAIQERIYEAVTGIVDIENTLAIGEHFGVWPLECYVVEADLPPNCFGRMVIADSEKRSDDAALLADLRFSPRQMVDTIVETCCALALYGEAAPVRLKPKRATALAPGTTFAQIRVVEGGATSQKESAR